MDGALDTGEWSDANVYNFDGGDQAPPGTVVEGTATDASDTSATLRLKHDAGYLYVAVEVNDDLIVTTAPEVWAADSVELFMDIDSSDTPNVGFDRFQLSVSAGGETSHAAGVPVNSWNGAVGGVSGGYSLNRGPETTSVAEVIRALEGPISMVQCGSDPGACEQEAVCPTRINWNRISQEVEHALERVPISEMVSGAPQSDLLPVVDGGTASATDGLSAGSAGEGEQP